MPSSRAPAPEGTIKARVVKGAFDEDTERSPVLAERSPAVALDGPGYGHASSTMDPKGADRTKKGASPPFWFGRVPDASAAGAFDFCC
jgi:hypothetical protein